MIFDELFQNKSPDFAKLKAGGFIERDGVWQYHVRIMEGEFELTVSILSDGTVKTELIECELGEPYTLHLVEGAEGEFVGRVREAYTKAMQAIVETCFETDVFRESLTRQLIYHAREKYGDEPEYLWAQFPDTAILRRKANAKWYALFMTVERKKLGMEGAGKVEVLDVRVDPTELPLLVDKKRIFPGWHMNKKHWVSIPLDGTVPLEEVIEYVEESWHLAK